MQSIIIILGMQLEYLERTHAGGTYANSENFGVLSPQFGPSCGASSLHHCATRGRMDSTRPRCFSCQLYSHKNYDIKTVYDRLYFTNMTGESVSQ